MKKITLNLLAVSCFAFAALALGGCNTAEGFGRDMQKAGESIQKSVN